MSGTFVLNECVPANQLPFFIKTLGTNQLKCLLFEVPVKYAKSKIYEEIGEGDQRLTDRTT